MHALFLAVLGPSIRGANQAPKSAGVFMIKHTSIRYPLASLAIVALAMQSACSDDGDSGSGSEGGADQGRGGGTGAQTGGRAGPTLKEFGCFGNTT
jgi:hypothetical protein